jgi:hypothetical protein
MNLEKIEKNTLIRTIWIMLETGCLSAVRLGKVFLILCALHEEQIRFETGVPLIEFTQVKTGKDNGYPFE